MTVKKHHDQSHLGTKGFIWFLLPYHCLSMKEDRTETQAGQNPEGRVRISAYIYDTLQN